MLSNSDELILYVSTFIIGDRRVKFGTWVYPLVQEGAPLIATGS